MDITEALEQSQPGLLGRVTDAIRKHQLNQRTEQNYLHWITRFVLFHGLKDPETLAPEDQQQFLDYLAESDEEDLRQIWSAIEQKREEEGLDNRALRRYVESGRYGSTAQRLWQAYIQANTTS